MNMENKPVLLLTGSQIHSVLWEPLSEHYQLAFIEGSVADICRQLGIDCIKALELVSSPHAEEMRSKAMWQANELMNKLLKNEVIFDPEHPYLSGDALRLWLPPYFYDRAAQVMTFIVAAARLAEDTGLAGILVHEDVTALGSGVSAFGNLEDIPTLHLAHANHFIKPGTTDIHCSTNAKHLGAAGTYMKDWYTVCGHDPENITLLGMPQWDKWHDKDLLPTKEQSRTAFGMDDDDFVITFAATWPQMVSVGGNAWERSIKVLDESWDTMARTAKKMDAKLIVKLHPTGGPGREELYKDKMEELGVKGLIIRDYGLHAISASDVVVSQSSSNFAIESLILDRPAVELYAPASAIEDIPGSWGEDLQEVISRAIEDGVDKNVIEKYNYLNDGNATERTIEWVREYAEI